jgi:hypothetical protein
MKWSEVIMVRSTDSNAKLLAKTVHDLMADVARSARKDDIRVFHRENIETDICIVLFHNEKKSRAGGSPLGLRFAAALKELGLVYHTVWREC